jgi:AraC-like DNA-binding protein
VGDLRAVEVSTAAERHAQVDHCLTGLLRPGHPGVGQTPIRYLTAVRLSRAAGYLTTTDANLSTIARRTG